MFTETTLTGGESSDGERMVASTYFAYGSNLNLGDFDRYCVKNGICCGGLHAVGPAVLPGYRLAFSHYSKARGGGALNVEACATESVHGVLFEVRDTPTWQVLDQKEGHPHRYQKSAVTIQLPCGKNQIATTYIVTHPRSAFFQPTEEYVQIVASGLQAFGLCTKALLSASGLMGICRQIRG